MITTNHTNNHSDIFREAIQDARLVREMAVFEAKEALTAALRPQVNKIQTMLAKQMDILGESQMKKYDNNNMTEYLERLTKENVRASHILNSMDDEEEDNEIIDSPEFTDDEENKEDEDAARTEQKLYDILEDYTDDLDDDDIDEIISRSEADLDIEEYDEEDEEYDLEDDRLGEMELDGYSNPNDEEEDDEEAEYEESFPIDETADGKYKAAKELGSVWQKYLNRKTFADMNNVWSGGVGASMSDEDRTMLQKSAGLLKEVIAGKKDWNKLDRKIQKCIVENFGEVKMSRTSEDNRVAFRMRKIANINVKDNIQGKSALDRVLDSINNPISGTALNHKSSASLLTETGSPLSVKESAERLLKG